MRELIAATALAVLLFALANSSHAVGTHTHASEPFAGVKANTGTVNVPEVAKVQNSGIHP